MSLDRSLSPRELECFEFFMKIYHNHILYTFNKNITTTRTKLWVIKHEVINKLIIFLVQLQQKQRIIIVLNAKPTVV